MRKILVFLSLIIVAVGVTLVSFAPDTLSMAVGITMIVIISLGLIFGIFPMISMQGGLINGIKSIDNAMLVQTDSMWSAILRIDPMFKQRTLDKLFKAYKEKVSHQHANGQMLGDIEEYINEDTLGLYSWNGVISQISGTLTGLGILGTFVGLIFGISEIGFTSVEATLASVQNLLSGIRMAFYTSIAGVILSILFNILHKITWNMTTRQLGLFLDNFHMKVIPAVEEQERYRMQRQINVIIDRLDRIPKNPGYSIGNSTGMNPVVAQKNEAILMPQIIDGMKNGEFLFVLQPKYDILSRKIVAAEAYVRWNHGKLGMVSPGVFLPIVEENGYITKLDEYVWEMVCKKIREWINNNEPIVPISLNISKTDILAGNVIEKLDNLLNTYNLLPRFLDIEVARNAFTEAQELTTSITTTLRQKGFKVIVDGFNGDFIPLNSISKLSIDELKFDIRGVDVKDTGFIKSVFSQAKQMSHTVNVEGVESMEQVSLLRKCGCSIGQGYFFSRPISTEEFIQTLKEEQ